ncbi:MAG: puuC [Acidimicrobiaceae bacterium]|nr:puuC [Acidimicrobiaceae bacterium]
MTKANWRALADAVSPRRQLFLGGTWQDPVAGGSLSVRSPIDGRSLGDVALADEHDVDRAVSLARGAFEDGRWSQLPPSERGATLVRWSQLCAAAGDELAVLVSLEMGKPITQARNVDVPALVKTLRWYGEVADKLVDERPHSARDAVTLITREPAGVVAAVVPWNFPLTIAGWKLAPALAVGCSVVLKLAEQSPFSMLRVAELGAEAGVPDGVLSVLNGLGPVAGRALGAHPDVDVLTFTGSTTVGRLFQCYAAESNLKRTWLELGGKSANVVFPDADLEAAAETAAWSAFYNQGEMCSAGSRLLVHEDVHDEVLRGVVAKAMAMAPGDPLEPVSATGAMVNEEHASNVASQVARARADGIEPVAGGLPCSPVAGGSYFAPTVFDRVNPALPIAQEEVFGPVLSVTTFRDDEEAVRLANGTRYGLAAGVWTNNLSRAHQISRRMRTGVVWVNCFEEGDLTVPFGGTKESGYGSDKSLHALDKFLDVKTTWIQLRS